MSPDADSNPAFATRERRSPVFRGAGASRSLEEAVSADYDSALAELGLSAKTGWQASVALYAIGGTLALFCSLAFPDLLPRGVGFLGVFALCFSVLCAYGSMHLTHRSWAMHVRLTTGVTIFYVAATIMGPPAAAFALFPLLTMPNACYLCSLRTAVGYVGATMLLIFAVLLNAGGTAHIARALICPTVVGLVATSMFLTSSRIRTLARYNRKLAFSDPLTGIANVRLLRSRIAEALADREAREPVALFAMDLDNFKLVNDRFDHTMGDAVLCAVAEEIAREIEPSDVAARRGGDEFSVFVPDPAGRDLEELQQRLRRAIQRARQATCPDITPTGSVAFVRSGAGDEAGTLIERADGALHDAKEASRAPRPSNVTSLHPTESQQSPTREPAAEKVEEPRHTVDHTWIVASRFLRSVAILIGVVSVTGLLTPLPLGAGVGVALAIALIATAFWGISRGEQAPSRAWLHAGWLASFALVATAAALADAAGTAVIDLFPLLILYCFLVFELRGALVYLLLGMTAFGAFAIGGDYTDAVMRTVVTVVTIAVVGIVMGKMRIATVRFARTNLELSERDALTGVANLRALRTRLHAVSSRKDAEKSHVSLIAIDLDWFKRVNDEYSHSTGDQVLVAVARAIEENVAVSDLVARRGGDEFCVVLESAGPREAAAVCERLGESIARARRRICPEIVASASITAIDCPPGEPTETLIKRADTALHEEKLRSHDSRRHAAAS